MTYHVDIDELAEATRLNMARISDDPELKLFALKLRTSVAIAERLEEIASQLHRIADVREEA